MRIESLNIKLLSTFCTAVWWISNENWKLVSWRLSLTSQNIRMNLKWELKGLYFPAMRKGYLADESQMRIERDKYAPWNRLTYSDESQMRIERSLSLLFNPFLWFRWISNENWKRRTRTVCTFVPYSDESQMRIERRKCSYLLLPRNIYRWISNENWKVQ